MKKIRKLLISMVAAFVLLSGITEITQQEFGLITVEAAAKIKLNKSKATIQKGKTLKLKVTGTKKKVKWSSSNKKVASVNKNGKVTAKAVGKATITAKVNGKKYKCQIVVKNTSSNNPYAKYYSKLKTYIQKHGSVNTSGERIIKDTYTYGKQLFTFSIVYNSDSDTFDCVVLQEDYSNDSIGGLRLYLKFKYSSNASLEAVWDVPTANVSYASTGTVNLTTYNRSKGINLKVTEKTGISSDSQANELTKAYLNVGLAGWNELLKTRVGITIQNLGFVNYKG